MASEQHGSVRSHLQNIREIEKEQGLAAAERALVQFIRDEAASSPEAFMALARLLAKGRRFDDALRAAQKARLLAPLEPEPHIMTGLVHLRLKDHFAAGEAFASALQLDRNSTRASLGAAAVKLAEENYDDALALCDRVLELDPSLERAHELIARIRMKQGNTEEALTELRALIAKNPANKRALRAYLGVLKREGRADEAVSFLESQVEENPGDRRRVRVLSAVAARAGRTDIATAPWREKIESGEGSVVDRIRLAMTLVQAGDTDAAKAAIAEIGNQRALRPVICKLEGDIALKAGDASGAIESYQAACVAARAEALGEAAEKAAENPEALAKAWKAHTAKSVMAAVRAKRSERSAGREEE